MAADHRSRLRRALRGPAAALGEIFGIEKRELAATLWAFLAFFCLLAGYYVLRPLREEMGIIFGTRGYPALYLGTFIGTTIAVPAWSALVARFPRRKLVPIAYRFLILTFIAFWIVFTTLPPSEIGWVAYGYFVWVSVINLFTVSIFWSLLVDLFTVERGKRLFGFIAGGGSAGALCGSLLTRELVVEIGIFNILWAPVLLLELCVQALRRMDRAALRDLPPGETSGAASAAPVGGGLLDAVQGIVRSRYLLGLCAWALLFSLSATIAYTTNGRIIEDAIEDSARRTQLFADLNAVVQILAFVAQTFLTGRVLRRFGVAAALGFLPAVHFLGFGALGFLPLLAVTCVFDVVRRSAEYGVVSPARQVLYTVVTRAEKYRAKSVIDTFVLRGFDALTVRIFPALQSAGLGLSAIAFWTAPLGFLWLLLARRLARDHAVRAREISLNS